MNNQLPEPLRMVEHELTTLLRRGRTVSWGLVKEVHPHLEPNSYGLLLWLRRSGSTRLTDLAARLGISKGTLSRQIRGLEALGLVRREPDPTDRRSAQLRLTEEGQRRFDAARSSRVAELEQALGTWSTRDLADFARLLRQFNESWSSERD